MKSTELQLGDVVCFETPVSSYPFREMTVVDITDIGVTLRRPYVALPHPEIPCSKNFDTIYKSKRHSNIINPGATYQFELGAEELFFSFTDPMIFTLLFRRDY